MAEARAHIPEGPDRPGPVLEPGLHSALDQLLREVNQARDLRLAVATVLRNAGEIVGAKSGAAIISPETGAHPQCIAPTPLRGGNPPPPPHHPPRGPPAGAARG